MGEGWSGGRRTNNGQQRTFEHTPDFDNIRKGHSGCKVEAYSFEDETFDREQSLSVCFHYLFVTITVSM